MPSPPPPPPPEVQIADEQRYLFVSKPATLTAPWWRSAACVGAEPELFFPIGPGDRRSRQRALAVCDGCPVRSRCLETARADPSLVGIWGGTDEQQRAELARASRAGR